MTTLMKGYDGGYSFGGRTTMSIRYIKPKSSFYVLGAASTVAVIFTARKFLSSKAQELAGDKFLMEARSGLRNPVLDLRKEPTSRLL